jgi:hypothetical protein
MACQPWAPWRRGRTLEEEEWTNPAIQYRNLGVMSLEKLKDEVPNYEIKCLVDVKLEEER